MASPSTLVSALIKARSGFEKVVKDSTAENGKFTYHYATLADAIRCTERPLADNGLVVIQKTRVGQDGTVLLVTRLAHEGGESEEGEYPLRPVKSDPQGYGSALTYARRYCLMAILGIAPKDDDGEAASRPAAPVKAPAAKPVSPPARQAPPAKPAAQRDPAEILDEPARRCLTQALSKKGKTWASVSEWLSQCTDVRADGVQASTSIKDITFGTLELIEQALAGKYKAPEKARAS